MRRLLPWLCCCAPVLGQAGCAGALPERPSIVAAAPLPSAPFAAREQASPLLLVAGQLPADLPEELAPVNPRLAELPLEPEKLALNEVLQRCLASDPKLRSGFESISQADADLLTASLRPNPEVFADIQLLPLGQTFNVDRQGGPPQSDVLISYPIDWFLFGKRAAAMMAARVGVQISEAQYADLIRQRLRDATLAHYDVLETRMKLSAAQAIVDNARQIEAGARQAKKPATELQRIRLHILKSEQELRLARAAHLGAKARLRVYLGKLDGDNDFTVTGELDDPTEHPELKGAELFALAEQNRPDLTALELKIRQAQAAVVSQRRQAYPQVAPQFGYSHQFQKDIGFPDANLWDAAVTFSVPLCNRNQGGRARASSELNQSQHDLHANLIALRAEIEQLMQEFLAAETSAEAVSKQDVQESITIRDKLIKGYLDGREQLLDLLDAMKNYHDTYDLEVSTRANYWRAAVKLNAAVGQAVVP